MHACNNIHVFSHTGYNTVIAHTDDVAVCPLTTKAFRIDEDSVIEATAMLSVALRNGFLLRN